MTHPLTPFILFLGAADGSAEVVCARDDRAGAYRMVSTRRLDSPHSSAGAPYSYMAGSGPTSRAPRSDAYPDFATFLDEGCIVHPRCLTCPLPSCIYDSPDGPQLFRTRVRQSFVHYARNQGIPWRLIARYLHLSLRRAYAIGQEGHHALYAHPRPWAGSLDPLPSTIGRDMFTTARLTYANRVR